MIKKIYFCFFLLVVSIVIGCSNNTGKTETPSVEENKPTIDYTSYDEYSIIVKNNTDYNFIAFMGKPKQNTLLGGIPAGAIQHKLNKNPSLFTQSQGYTISLVKEADYIANCNDLSKTEPFTCLYVYYSENSNNTTVYEVSNKLGGNGKIRLTNRTGYVIELRLDSPSGEVLYYCSPDSSFQTINVEANTNYIIYPVFKQWNSLTEEVISIYPTYKSGRLAGRRYCEAFSLSDDDVMTFDCSDWLGTGMNLNSFYLQIQNDSDNGVRLKKGDSLVQVSDTGLSVVTAHETKTFSILLPNAIEENEDCYINDLSIENSRETQKLPPFTFTAGYVYKVICNGPDGEINLSEITLVGILDLFTNKIVPIIE